jgi:hypothetical protein
MVIPVKMERLPAALFGKRLNENTFAANGVHAAEVCRYHCPLGEVAASPREREDEFDAGSTGTYPTNYRHFGKAAT